MFLRIITERIRLDCLPEAQRPADSSSRFIGAAIVQPNILQWQKLSEAVFRSVRPVSDILVMISAVLRLPHLLTFIKDGARSV